MLDCILQVAGGAALLYIAVGILSFFYSNFIGGRKSLKAKPGRWAVVTGASDGIGKEFCIELAKKGFNICLLSRTEKKLKDVAEQLEKLNPQIQTKVVPVDFSANPDKYVDTLNKSLSDLEVEVLINNVGISFNYPENFLETPNELDDNMLNINIQSMLKMTRAVAPGMADRKSGYIVNVSSFSGVIPVPMLSTYSSSKAFVDFWSKCLQEEYKSSGITVKCVTPLYVATEMAKMRKSFTVPTPSAVAKATLSRLGSGPVTFNPYWVHAVMGAFMSLLPESIAISQLHSMNKSIKKRALAKIARAKQQQ